MFRSSSSPNLEGIELKEPTPSIATSIYEPAIYTKKWRIFFAFGFGVSLIAICLLIFYLSAESKRPKLELEIKKKTPFLLHKNEDIKWRVENGTCSKILSPKCSHDFGSIVILFVLSGVRTDEVSEIKTLEELIRCGVTSSSLVPVYPTFSSFNLKAIDTGLFPSWQKSSSVIKKNSLPEVLRKAGKKVVTLNWLNSEYDETSSGERHFSDTIDKVIETLHQNRSNRADLMLIFHDNVAKTALKFGPFSPNTMKELSDIDSGLDTLMQYLYVKNITNCVDLIIASEIGVAANLCQNSINIHNVIKEKIPADVRTKDVVKIRFFYGTDENMIKNMTEELKCGSNAMRVMSRDEIPKRYHYSHALNSKDLLIDVQAGHWISDGESDKCFPSQFGLDTQSKSMQGIFVAHGPNFKTNFKTASFRNIEIYNFIFLLLKLQPPPNNGTLEKLHNLINDTSEIDHKITKKHFLKEVVKNMPFRKDLAIKINEGTNYKHFCELQQKRKETPVTQAASLTEKTVLDENPKNNKSGRVFEVDETPFEFPAGNISNPTELSTENENFTESPIETTENRTVVNKIENFDHVSKTTDILSEIDANDLKTMEKTTNIAEIDKNLKANETTNNISELNQNNLEIFEETNTETFEEKEKETVKLKEYIVENANNLSKITQKNADASKPNVPTFDVENVIKTTRPATVVKTATVFAVSYSGLDSDSHNSSTHAKNDSPTHQLTKNDSTAQIITKNNSPSNIDTQNDAHSSIATLITKAAPTYVFTRNDSPVDVDSSKTNSNLPNLSTVIIIKPNEINSEVKDTRNNNNNKNNISSSEEIVLPKIGIKGSLVRKRRASEGDEVVNYKFHIPWGSPKYRFADKMESILILPQTSHVLGYLEKVDVPLWTSFTITNERFVEIEKLRPLNLKGIYVRPEDRLTDTRTGYWEPDVRLNLTPEEQCEKFLILREKEFNVSVTQLFPKEFENNQTLSKEGFLLSNYVLLRHGYEKGGRMAMIETLQRWGQTKTLNVIHGPIFDNNFDGIADNILESESESDYERQIPTDFFFVVTECTEKKINKIDNNNSNEIDTNSNKKLNKVESLNIEKSLEKCEFSNLEINCFVFPNIEKNNMCKMSDEDYVEYHTTSLDDVKRLTGLHFFSLIDA